MLGVGSKGRKKYQINRKRFSFSKLEENSTSNTLLNIQVSIYFISLQEEIILNNIKSNRFLSPLINRYQHENTQCEY